MRFLFIVAIALTSCRSTEIDFFDIMQKNEIKELNQAIGEFNMKTGHWPTSSDIESFKHSNNYLRNFNEVKLYGRPDSTAMVTFKLRYKDFEDPIRLLEMTEFIKPSSIEMNMDNLVIQDNIPLGQRTKLTKKERKEFKKWDKLRIDSRKLIVENTMTKEILDIKVNSHIYLFAQDTLLVMQERLSSQGWVNQRAEWILSTINSSDSTINLDHYSAGILRRRVKFTDVDSLNLKSKPGTFKIIGVKDTAHNKKL